MSTRTLSQTKLSTNVYNKRQVFVNGSGLFTSSSSNYLNLGDQSGLKLGSSDYTVETWIRRTSTVAYMGICGDYTGSTGSFCLFFDDTGTKLSWYHAGSFVLTTSATIAIDTWVHFAAVRSSGTLTFYVNGTSSGSVSHTTNYSNSSPFFIGQSPPLPVPSTANYFNGYLSNFRIVKSAVYTSTFTPLKKLGSISETALLTLQNSDVIVDNGPNSYAITNVNSVAASSVVP